MMKIDISDNLFNLDFGFIKFSGLYPVINDVSYRGTTPIIKRNDLNGFELCYKRQNDEVNAFLVSISYLNGELLVQFHLEGCSNPSVINNFGLGFENVVGVSTFLSNGYHSWDGSVYMDDDSLGEYRHYQSYGMTQLISKGRQHILTLGFDRHDRYQQYFVHKNEEGNRALEVVSCWDRKLSRNTTLSSEKIRFFETEDVESGLRQWAEMVAENASTPPRIPRKRMIGWCSWYNLYASITEENILENLSGVIKVRERERIDFDVFLIDDGFTPEMGDWLECKPQFPNGVQPIVQAVREAGLTLGLWIAPFLVGNRSKLFKQHPDWVVKEAETGRPFACMKFYGEFRWHKRSEEYYLLDITYPPAAQYLQHVLKTWHDEWGVDYFKTDFLYLVADNGPDKVTHHQAGLTRIEYWRRGCELIRDAVGSAFLAGCGVPLWAGVGIFDSVRIGNDMGVDWVSAETPKSPLVSIPNRNFINGVLYQTDPDCVLLRNEFHNFSEIEINALLTLAGLTGGTLMTSDYLPDVSSQLLERFKYLASLDEKPGCFINLGDPHDLLIVQIRQEEKSGDIEHLFFLNGAETQLNRLIPLKNLGLNQDLTLMCVDTNEKLKLLQENFELHLDPHESRWFRILA
ncbi:MAG: alpha-galactosidase [Brevefilum sp.]|nr:alpha-galactosidase [Brevefilum sp.]